MTRSAIRAIDWYQATISPRKGFSCAYRVAWGGRSCSGVVKNAFQRAGLIGGLRALFTQPFKCHAAARVFRESGGFHGSNATRATPEVLFCCFLPF
jgi:uncharacterized protein